MVNTEGVSQCELYEDILKGVSYSKRNAVDLGQVLIY